MCHKEKKTNISFRSQIWYWHPAEFWVKDFTLPHKYQAPNSY